MPVLVLFMRAVNVGGHQTFRPAQLARDLAPFEAVNIGAAGTFVVRRAPSGAALAAAVRARVPFDTELMICRAGDVAAAAADLGKLPPIEGAQPVLSVLARRPAATPVLPVCKPEGERWEMRLELVASRYAWTLYRPLGPRPLNVNAFVEKTLGVAATSRNANTLAAVQKVVSSSSSSGSRPR